MRNYEEKFAFLANRVGWLCPILLARGRRERVTDLHHRYHNTRENRNACPLLIDSFLNLAAVSRDGHLMRPYWRRLSRNEAMHREGCLRRWPHAAAFVNGRTERLEWYGSSSERPENNPGLSREEGVST